MNLRDITSNPHAKKSQSGSTELTPWFFADKYTQPLDVLKFVDGTEYGRSILGGQTLEETRRAAAKSYKNRLLSGIATTFWDGRAPSADYFQ